MDSVQKDEVRKIVESFDYVHHVSKVNTNKKILGDNAVEVDLWANKPALEIRQELMEELKKSFPKNKFNLVFFINIAKPYQN